MDDAPATTCRMCAVPMTPDLRARRIFMVTVPLLLVVALIASPRWTALAVVAALVLVSAILVHEAGHMLAARRRGMAMTEFAIGFGPVMWSHHARGLWWTVRAVPLGGFCHVVGHPETDVLCEEHAPDHPGIPMWRTRIRDQLWLAMAGNAANMALAWVLMLPVSLQMVHAESGGVGVRGVLVALLMTTAIVAVAPFLSYFAIATYVAAIPSVGWTDEMGSVLSLPDQIDSMIGSGGGGLGLPLGYTLLLAAVGINLSLAALNALPVYMLDGFHAVTIAARALRGGRPLQPRVVTVLAIGTGAPFLLLVIGLLAKDVAAWFV